MALGPGRFGDICDAMDWKMMRDATDGIWINCCRDGPGPEAHDSRRERIRTEDPPAGGERRRAPPVNTTTGACNVGPEHATCQLDGPTQQKQLCPAASHHVECWLTSSGTTPLQAGLSASQTPPPSLHGSIPIFNVHTVHPASCSTAHPGKPLQLPWRRPTRRVASASGVSQATPMPLSQQLAPYPHRKQPDRSGGPGRGAAAAAAAAAAYWTCDTVREDGRELVGEGCLECALWLLSGQSFQSKHHFSSLWSQSFISSKAAFCLGFLSHNLPAHGLHGAAPAAYFT
ncbi:uncharacterized protein J3D65DRAFT_307698 [Phyllosticta citribraziliensis]|uniref:Uncharacterized protein n=1 Tax=Phyllosticta citribraziliensis TaxID=989973 RepID=A0ABR1LY07_9PEZI